MWSGYWIGFILFINQNMSKRKRDVTDWKALGHETKKKEGGQGRWAIQLDPFHKRWPKKFLQGKTHVKFDQFLRELNKKNIKEIISEEVDYELSLTKTQEVDEDGDPVFDVNVITGVRKPRMSNRFNTQKGYMGMFSWSLLRQIEKTYKTKASSCYSSLQCLLDLFSQLTKNETDLDTHLGLLFQLRLALFPKSVQVNSSTAARLGGFAKDIKDRIKDLKWWQEKNTKNKTTEGQKQWKYSMANLTIKWFKNWNTETVKNVSKTNISDRAIKNQREPILIHEKVILELRDWMREIAFGPGPLLKDGKKKTKKVKVLTNKALVCCMLLQVSIGSRFRGILLHNEIDFYVPQVPVQKDRTSRLQKKQYKRDPEIKVDAEWWGDQVKTDDTETTEEFFREQTDLLSVSRLSKEGSQTSKKDKVIQSMIADEEKAGADGEPEDLSNEMKNTDLVKKVDKSTLWMFLTGTEFMTMFQDCRKAIATAFKSQYPTVKWPLDEDTLYKKEASSFGTKEVARAGDMIQKWFVERGKYHLLSHNPGAHFLRKIYVNYSYLMFDEARTMKDTAWACKVLGHTNISVSLRYTDLIIQTTVRPGKSFDGYVSHKFTVLRQKLEFLESEIQKLRDAQSVTDGEFVSVTTESGKNERIEKLPTVRGEKNKVRRVLDEMYDWKDKGIQFTRKNIMSLGVGSTLVTEVKNHSDYKLVVQGKYKKSVD